MTPSQPLWLPLVLKGERKPSETDDTGKLKASIVSQDVLFAPKTNIGLGLHRVSTFWSVITLGRLRRPGHNSFWENLHIGRGSPLVLIVQVKCDDVGIELESCYFFETWSWYGDGGYYIQILQINIYVFGGLEDMADALAMPQ